MRERTTTEGKQFDDVVQASRIGLTFGNNWQDALHIFFGKIRGGPVSFAGFEPVEVALQGIDLAIMGNKPERLSQLPGRESIGGKAGVYQSKRTHEARIGQIREIRAHLMTGQLTFIYHCFIRHRGKVEANFIFAHRTVNQVTGVVAEYKKLPLKFVGVENIIRAGNEYLFHFGFYRQCSGTNIFGIDRDFSPV